MRMAHLLDHKTVRVARNVVVVEQQLLSKFERENRTSE